MIARSYPRIGDIDSRNVSTGGEAHRTRKPEGFEKLDNEAWEVFKVRDRSLAGVDDEKLPEARRC